MPSFVHAEDIIAGIANFEQKHRASNKSRRISVQIQPLLNAITGYGKAIDADFTGCVQSTDAILQRILA
jgi:hypothetical protein